ncbi:hypothetical protein [Alkalibacterium kapii]|uniref:Uncharacterized protein n=1 Tax=Alkalibacterium kapii TaxID=426704 RepID=A0A511AUL8_9LACT|nr:hypothetical protein [Alkalibacterium kapii]GEK91834.1 hypothetical protein AKA01nite_14560 [Alkalibacterium kapii]
MMDDLRCPYCGSKMLSLNELGSDKYMCDCCGKTFGSKVNKAMNVCHTFYFRTGGFHEGFKSILIEEQDSFANIIVTPPFSIDEEGLKLRITFNEWQSIKDTLFNKLFILSWDEDYYDPYVLDGTQWELKLKFYDRKNHEISGSNVFPELFDELLDYLKTYFEQVEAEEK